MNMNTHVLLYISNAQHNRITAARSVHIPNNLAINGFTVKKELVLMRIISVVFSDIGLLQYLMDVSVQIAWTRFFAEYVYISIVDHEKWGCSFWNCFLFSAWPYFDLVDNRARPKSRSWNFTNFERIGLLWTSMNSWDHQLLFEYQMDIVCHNQAHIINNDRFLTYNISRSWMTLVILVGWVIWGHYCISGIIKLDIVW